MKDTLQGFIKGPPKVKKHLNLREIPFKMLSVVGKKKVGLF